MIDQFQRELYDEARLSLDATRWDVPPIPGRLISQVVGAGGTTEGFHYGGFTTALGMRTTLKLLGVKWPAAGAILDFGCGPARVLRWLCDLPATTLYGADVNGESVDWCQRSEIPARFIRNSPFPPLPVADSLFDIVFAISVLTHLDEQHHLSWLREFRRVIRPNGLLMATVHGRNKARQTLGRAAFAEYSKNGFFFWRPVERTTLDGLPDFYQVAFHSKEYVERTWSRLFEPLLYVSHGPFYEQELIVLRNSRRRVRQPSRDRRLPLAVLDSPAAGSTVQSREMLVSGWAFFPDRRGPFAIDIWVDGRRVGRCHTGEDRPDVSAALRSRHAEQSGFCASVSIDTLKGDKHVVWLTAGDDPMPLAATYFASDGTLAGTSSDFAS